MGPLCQRVFLLCIDKGRFAASPIWRQDDVSVRLWCETRTYYTRGDSELASQEPFRVDSQRNLVWPV